MWVRQPTSSPVPSRITIVRIAPSISAKKWPSRYAERGIGSDRNRSIEPDWKSVATDVAGPIAANARVWMRIPAIRYSL